MKTLRIFHSIPKPITFVLLIILGCSVTVYSLRCTSQREAIQTHRTICQNLVAMGRIKEEDCLSPSTYYEEYILVYFPIETTTKDTVWQGMMGVTIYRNIFTGRCEANNLSSQLEYRIMLGFEVTFVFCGNQLIHTWFTN